MSLLPLKKPLDQAFEKMDVQRTRELYNRELKKGVQLGRKLGAFETRYGKLRNFVTDLCVQAIVIQGLDPNSVTVRAFRNAVRIMKGKNKV